MVMLALTGCVSQQYAPEESDSESQEEGYAGPDPRVALSSALAGALNCGLTTDQIAAFTTAVDLLINGSYQEAASAFDNLSGALESEDLSTLRIDPPKSALSFFHGLHFTDIREARIALANIDTIKADGFDTVLLQAQLVPTSNGTLLIPGKEVYLFYINAFHASGFHVWLAVGHTSYEFSKYRDTISEEDLPTWYDRVEPYILEWATIAEQYAVSAFIPLEEPEDFIEKESPPRLSAEQQQTLSNWSQGIRSQVESRYSGDLVFTVEDWSSMGSVLTPSGAPYDTGPGLNYTGYSCIALKASYFNGLDREMWLKDMDARLTNAKAYAERDHVSEVVWYEVGTPMDRGLNPDLGTHLVPLSDEQQQTVFRDIINISVEHALDGLFFKLSPEQPHEGSWNFLYKPAEMVLRDAFAEDGRLADRPLDALWVSLGEEGLKALQLAIADDIPFDPDYSLDGGYYDGSYHDLELAIDGECIGDELYT